MDFNEKIKLIEQARKDYPEFELEFTEYLGLGNSFNGAYNHFGIADIEKYKPAAVVTKVVATPVAVEAVKAQPKVVASKVVTK
jgi:hypothetical protein